MSVHEEVRSQESSPRVLSHPEYTTYRQCRMLAQSGLARITSARSSIQDSAKQGTAEGVKSRVVYPFPTTGHLDVSNAIAFYRRVSSMSREDVADALGVSKGVLEEIASADYGRYFCETRTQLEVENSRLLGAEDSIFYESEMAGINDLILAHVKEGDSLLLGINKDSKAAQLFEFYSEIIGFSCSFVNVEDSISLAEAFNKPVNLVFFEDPGSTDLVKFSEVMDLAEAKDVKVVFDASGVEAGLHRCFEKGVDLVLRRDLYKINGSFSAVSIMSGSFEHLRPLRDWYPRKGNYVAPEVSAAIIAQTRKVDSAFLGEQNSNEDSRLEVSSQVKIKVEDYISRLENAEDTIAYETGMAAINALFLDFIKPGAHFLIGKETYRQTKKILAKYQQLVPFTFDLVDTINLEEVQRMIRDETSLLLLENPTNPFLSVSDIEGIVKIAHKVGAKVAIDSTFATPANQKPLDLGADFVLHSATKYFSGGIERFGGTISSTKANLSRLRKRYDLFGTHISDFALKEIYESLQNLEERVKKQNYNAQKLAEFLERRSEARKVYYPGLETHRSHSIAKESMTGFGGVLSFQFEGDSEKTKDFLDRLNSYPKIKTLIAPSLGADPLLIEMPATISYAQEYTSQQRKDLGMHDNLVRVAVGTQDIDLIIEAFEFAFSDC